MNLWLLAWIVTIVFGITAHIGVGVRIKKRFKVANLYSDFKSYYSDYKRERRSIKYYARYLVYLVPILNVAIGVVEIVKSEEVYLEVYANLKKYISKKGD